MLANNAVSRPKNGYACELVWNATAREYWVRVVELVLITALNRPCEQMADTARVDNDVTFEPDTIFAPVGDTLD